MKKFYRKWRVSLFNGNDLTGWELIEGTASYTVENGEIVGAQNATSSKISRENGGILSTKDIFANFVLELQVRVDTAMNSSIQIRSHTKDVNGKNGVYGYQIEVDASRRAWSGGIYDSRR